MDLHAFEFGISRNPSGSRDRHKITHTRIVSYELTHTRPHSHRPHGSVQPHPHHLPDVRLVDEGHTRQPTKEGVGTV